jgi:hypothetical protein
MLRKLTKRGKFVCSNEQMFQRPATSRHKAHRSCCRDKEGGMQLARTNFIWTDGFAEATVSTDACDYEIRNREASENKRK